MTKFAARMTEAFARLGAADVGRQWSRFNVDDPTARSNGAERLVTAIWNIHTKVGAHGERVPTHPAIERDEPTGELWYRTYRIKPGDNPSSARTAHWNRLQFARTRGIPVIGILKDQVSRRLSLEDVFDVNAFAEGRDPDVLWMRLQPRGPYAGEIHPIRIAELARGVQTHPTVGSEAADPEEPLARVEADLDAIRSDQGLDATTREVLTQARVGQGRFRDQVLAAWGGACAVTGISVPEVLRASHIVAWRDCASNAERLDPNNGLALSASLDALFDRGLIAFADDGRMLVSQRLSESDRKLLQLPSPLLRQPTSEAQGFLQRHRKKHRF